MKSVLIIICLSVILCNLASAEIVYKKKTRTLSVKADGQDLESLLYEIQEKTGIPIEIVDGVEGNVYEEFQNLSIENSLRRILKTKNYSVVYADGSIEKIYIFPGGNAASEQRTAPSSVIMPEPKRR